MYLNFKLIVSLVDKTFEVFNSKTYDFLHVFLMIHKNVGRHFENEGKCQILTTLLAKYVDSELHEIGQGF